MTVTIRIQYKGEGARKLLAEENSPDRDTSRRYAEDMNRALSMFAIPNPPDHSRVIWKSGFVLCNYNTTRDTPLFDRIYRGAFRAQSIACRATLDGLHISYIHLFENSKPVFFGKQGQHQQPQDNDTNLPPPTPTHGLYVPRHRSRSPPPKYYHKQWTRPLGPELSRQLPMAESAPSDYRSQSVDQEVVVKPEPSEAFVPAGQSPTNNGTAANGAAAAPGIPEALKKLVESHTLLSLLGQTPAPTSTDAERYVKQEFDFPKLVEPPRAPRSLLANTSNGESLDFSTRRPLSPSPRPGGFAYHQKDDRLPRPPTLEGRYNSASRSFNYKFNNNRRTFSPPPHRGRSTSPVGVRDIAPYEPTWRQTGYGADAKHAPGYTPKKWYNRSRSPNQKRSFNFDKLNTPSPWFKGPLKRPLSPTLTPGRAGSPPYKRRFSMNEPIGRSSPMQGDVVARPPSSNGGLNGAYLPRGSPPPSSVPLSRLGSSVNRNEPPQLLTRAQQITVLNRELWSVRREVTALKAREECILSDLKTMRAPEFAEDSVMPPKSPSPEEKLKLLEAEITSLRSRLQSETVRRQLVEEACENERRRRKHAEDLLDDARRESTAPAVVPAMMDAFERIAQLTGEALMPTSD